MKLNKSLLSFFLPMAFVFGVLMLYMAMGENWPFWAALLGVGQALAFTCFAWLLSMITPDGVRLVWNWQSRSLVASWLLLFLLTALPASPAWLFAALIVISILTICLTKVTVTSSLWMSVERGAGEVELVAPGTQSSLVWWSNVKLREISKQEDLVVKFAIPSHAKEGLCINFFSVSCVLFFEGAGTGPLRPYSEAIAELKTAIGFEIQDGVVPQPNKAGVYMVNLPADLLANGGRLVDVGGYLIRISLIRPSS